MIEVLKQALDALETEVSIDWTNNDEFNASAEKMHDAITSLQQAIKELESQEPVATVTSETGADITMSWWHEPALPVGTKLYAHPSQRTWVGLTDEDKKQMAKEANYHWEMTAGEYAERIGQLTEAKLKQKNGFAEEKNT